MAWLRLAENCKIVGQTTLIGLIGVKAHQKCFQTSFILGEQAGRVDISSVGWTGGGGGQRGGQRNTRESTLPLPATMLCCGGKKVRESAPFIFSLILDCVIQPTVSFHLNLRFDGKFENFAFLGII